MKKNYQIELDQIIENIPKGEAPTLLLHACCAPCSSYCLEYLSKYFRITLFYYNPNISSDREYLKRILEVKRLITEMPFTNPVSIIEGDYEPAVFKEMAKGLEEEPERGRRCYKCYELRLRETARVASNMGFDYFTTTLSISPHKNADWINEIGERLGDEYNIKHLPSDFKKKDGYKRSIELSEEYKLYRQNFCGCIYSQNVVE